MTYNPVPRDEKFLEDLLSDPQALAIYEQTKLEIEQAIQSKKDMPGQKDESF